MITIGKTVVSGATAVQIRDQVAGLATDRLGDLAVQLAADPDLTVSVITYDDGRLELEVLHTGPPHRTEDTIDCRRFTGQHPQATSRTFSIAAPTGLQAAVTLVHAILVDDTAADGQGPSAPRESPAPAAQPVPSPQPRANRFPGLQGAPETRTRPRGVMRVPGLPARLAVTG